MSHEFLGFLRADGRIGVRNRLLVLSVNGLTGPAARRIAAALPGAVAVTMPYGAGLLGQDRAVNRRALLGLATHPNVGGTVLVGADPPKVEDLTHACQDAGQPVVGLCLDDCGHDSLELSARGIRAGARLMKQLSRERRRPVPVGRLFLGMECGRSDPSSGLVANPLVGHIADRVVDAGGRVVIGETAEWIGAEERLAARARTPAVQQAVLAAAARREALAVTAGIPLTGNNPSATNIAAGLSSIEEKSLGAIAKSGSRPLQGLLEYAAAPDAAGLFVMDAPAYAPESLTGFTAAGAQLVLFTTGVGNSFGSALAPTIKISANPDSAERLQEQLDFDASAVFCGHENIEDATARLFDTLLDIACGTLTWSEILGEGEEVVSRFEPAL